LNPLPSSVLGKKFLFFPFKSKLTSGWRKKKKWEFGEFSPGKKKHYFQMRV
jgi:hypothetical protein